MPRGRCWNWYGPAYDWSPALAPGPYGLGFGAGFHGGFGGFGRGGFGLGAGLRGYGGFAGLGWLVYDALKEGPKSQEEIASWISSKFQTPVLSSYLAPLLEWWTSAGLLKKEPDGKYSVAQSAGWPLWGWGRGPWW